MNSGPLGRLVALVPIRPSTRRLIINPRGAPVPSYQGGAPAGAEEAARGGSDMSRPTPYYQDGAVTIYLGDALELLAESNFKLDAVITDPPYASGASLVARRNKRASVTPESVEARPIIAMDDMGLMGYDWLTRRWFLSVRRQVLPGGHLACFTDWRMAPTVQTLPEAGGWRLTNLLVWDKGYPGLGSGFRAQHEMVVVASRGEPRWHSYDYGNVLQATRLTDTDHPHEKPLSLLKSILSTCTPVGGLVLDPFMGSGTTLRAAKELGRKAIGIEVDEAYCEIAANRMRQEVLPLEVAG